MSFYITKSSGDQELFDANKFKRSLHKAGADDQTINEIVKHIESQPGIRTTKDIYQYAFDYLTEINRPLASRYSLKNAIYQLGPAGFPFEQYVAAIFEHQNYSVKTNQIITGLCVNHEIDVIISRSEQNSEMIECKFHDIHGEKVNIKTVLYVKSRFEDIKVKNKEFNHVWLVTNSQFTQDSKQYANCAKIKLLGWGYPSNNGIETIIDQLGLHPITTMVSLTKRQKLFLIQNNLLLCQDIPNNINLLQQAGLNMLQIAQLTEEAEIICKLKQKSA